MKFPALLTGLALFLTPFAFGAASLPTLPPLAAELVALQPAGLLPNDAVDFTFSDRTAGTNRATFIALPDAGPGLSFRAEIFVRGKTSYEVESKLKTIAAVQKGDTVLARFLARAPVARQESGEGSVQFAFQRGVAPYEKSVVVTVTPGPEWSVFEIPFTVANDFAAGEAVVALALADLPQTVEITGLELLKFGTRARLEQLPKTRFTYKGREADARWRTAALKRIEELRTAPLNIRVTDGAGRPLAGARVEAQLIQSEFIWGTAVNEAMLADELPDSANYRRVLREFFNTTVIENGFKWPSWDSSPERRAQTKRAFEWLEREGFRQKGHNLVWPGWKFAPKIARETAERDPIAFKKIIEDNIREKMEYTRNRVIGWDVINELIHERDFLAFLPEDAPLQWFRLARELDPNAQLVLNDYGMLNSARSPGTIERFREIIKSLRVAGAPIDAIGIQGHVGQQPRAPALVLSDLDLMAGEGLPVQITEFDVNTKDEELQADYTRDFLIACYSHPALTGFLKWGFWESKHWKPDAAMFRKDWSEKPNAAVWREWVRGKWNTRLDATTPAAGTAFVRGHLGRYRVTVTNNGVVNRQDLTLTRCGAELTVKFP
jgi:endo-1,4-beta-xylanase